MVHLTMLHLKRVRTSLVKHKYARKEASMPSLKTVHRTVFLTPSTTWSFSVVHKCTSSNSLLQLFLELLSSATGSSRSRHTLSLVSCIAGIIKRPNTYILGLLMVHLTRLELARIFIHMDLNHTRLPLPPQVRVYSINHFNIYCNQQEENSQVI